MSGIAGATRLLLLLLLARLSLLPPPAVLSVTIRDEPGAGEMLGEGPMDSLGVERAVERPDPVLLMLAAGANKDVDFDAVGLADLAEIEHAPRAAERRRQ